MKVKGNFLTRFGHFQGQNDRDQMTHHPIRILSLEDQIKQPWEAKTTLHRQSII